jgi:hypothetical protein
MKCPALGSRKSSGDTLCVVLTPLHPASVNNTPPQAVGCTIFHFNLTIW